MICDVRQEKSHALVSVAPRSMLRRQCERAAAMGFHVMASSELEYYIFRQSYREAAARKGYAGLEPASWYLEDYHALQGTRHEPFHGAVRRHLKNSGVPVESSKGEWGLGQHELNIRYADVLAMADRHCIYKQCLKEVADQQGLSVTFMAKFAADRAGSSCHVHLSLWRGEHNAFAGEQALGPVRSSDTFRWFLGGWIAHRRRSSRVCLRADGRSVQAATSRLVGSDQPRLETRQPDSRVSSGRSRPQSAHRVPHPRCRLQSVPGIRSGTGRWARRYRSTHRAAAALRGRRLHRRPAAARAGELAGRPRCSETTLAIEAFGRMW